MSLPLLPVPWTLAYNEFRENTLRSMVHDPALIACVGKGANLPVGHGRGLDERFVELPWLLAHLPVGRKRLLDAGSSLNHSILLDLPQGRRKTPSCRHARARAGRFLEARRLLHL